MSGDFDVMVIGGGHAGSEAAWAAARLRARTALITMQAGAIGRMSCNPAIGGLGKGQMVREIDALGGIMGLAIDAAGIQFRMLNTSKGPAVQAPRAQADRESYAAAVQRILRGERRIEIIEDLVESIETVQSDGTARVSGVRLASGRRLDAPAVVVTTGTFLRAMMHCGETQTEGGRVNEGSAAGMSGALQRLGLALGRLKTGTPPRVHRDSVDYNRLQPQPGDPEPVPFSFVTDRIDRRQINCWITHTNDHTHEIIRANLYRAPMFNGQIQARGPRYCPSIEDKVVRFADQPRHQLFLEPEGYDDERVYCNGISTSLPAEVQHEVVHSIAGLEGARILQPGYAVEYDFVPTHQIGASLETRLVGGLFLAGQINGTSGYEEAAAQGLIAGINAVRVLGDGEPLILRRDQAYIGVMIDDLVTRPPTEPYRMFTSRAEFRLCLRSDNADQRLTPIGRRVGLVDDRRWRVFEEKQQQIARIVTLLRAKRNGAVPVWPGWLRRPESGLAELTAALGPDGGARFGPAALGHVLIEAKYDGYLARQAKQIERFRRNEDRVIPESLDYQHVPQLRREAREQLVTYRPRTLGQAQRISGITPADILILSVHLAGRSQVTERARPVVNLCAQ